MTISELQVKITGDDSNAQRALDRTKASLRSTQEAAEATARALGRAFERFSRADAARGRGGAGLGLAIVRTIAQAHGGSAHAENRRPGADVWLALPQPGS